VGLVAVPGDFAIEPALLPLVRTMHAEANGEGPVVTFRQQKWWAADPQTAPGTEPGADSGGRLAPSPPAGLARPF
jgi:hypothetical protein